jgi:UDP-N-acetylglucosamine 4,6-dehydratase/UDP-glucose 4-epimerase
MRSSRVQALSTKLFEGKSVFITGACGSLGSNLVRRLVNTDARRIVAFDNNQSKLDEMERRSKDRRLRFFLGDVRDSRRLRRAIERCDVILHCAALKIIPSCEYNPTEAIATNIIGSQNIIECAMDAEPEIVTAISSDKACAPLNLYGATKLCMEKLFTAANFIKGDRRMVFTCVRYGNVLGSNDSVIPLWKEQLKLRKPLTITNPDMTRFSITIDEAINFVFRSLAKARGGEVFIPKLRAYVIRNLLEAFAQLSGRETSVVEMGDRTGEKRDEVLINEHETKLAFDIGTDYVILPDPATRERYGLKYDFNVMKPFNDSERAYSSLNADKMTPEELKQLLVKERLLED